MARFLLHDFWQYFHLHSLFLFVLNKRPKDCILTYNEEIIDYKSISVLLTASFRTVTVNLASLYNALKYKHIDFSKCELYTLMTANVHKCRRIKSLRFLNDKLQEREYLAISKKSAIFAHRNDKTHLSELT